MLQQGEIEKLREIWLTITNKQVYSSSPFSWINVFNDKASIYDSEPLNRLLTKYLNPKKLKENPIPFMISTTDMVHKENYCLKISDLEENEIQAFIRASASPPVYFPPVKFRGKTLADGGVSNNFLINKAIKDENRILVITTPTTIDFLDVKNVLDALGVVTSISEFISLQMALDYVDKINGIIRANPKPGVKEIKAVLVRPPVSTGIPLLDFNYKQDRSRVIDYGYQTAKKTLKEAFDL